jgi:DNA repair photolyase
LPRPVDNPPNPWSSTHVEYLDEPPPARLEVFHDHARSIIARNDSPDIPFDRSINPYRGCEHGCVYCYARPTHGWLGLSAGLDFETRIFFKPDAARLLRAELARPGYRPAPIAFGTNTDPYQPAERGLRITRALLELLAEHDHPVTIVTKSALVLRDADILGPMSRRRLARVFLSVTTLDRGLARRLEPRASSPARRLEAIAGLAAAGVDGGVMAAPIMPALTDHELERLPKEGRKRLLILCPAFVADCLETIEEISGEGTEMFLEAGGESFTQIPCLNDHPSYIEFLAGRVRRWLEHGTV